MKCSMLAAAVIVLSPAAARALPQVPDRYRVDTHLAWNTVSWGDLASAPADSLNTSLGFRIQLIQPSDGKYNDAAIADVNEALHGLFAYPGYRLLDQSWVALDYSGDSKRIPAVATLQLSSNGTGYSLRLVVDSVSPAAVRVNVEMYQQSALTAGASGNVIASSQREIFSTTVMVGFNKTVVLGATHPFADAAAGTPADRAGYLDKTKALKQGITNKDADLPLILVIRPEKRTSD